MMSQNSKEMEKPKFHELRVKARFTIISIMIGIKNLNEKLFNSC